MRELGTTNDTFIFLKIALIFFRKKKCPVFLQKQILTMKSEMKRGS